MTDDELNIWFYDNLNSCYTVKHDYYNTGDILFIYDKSYARKLKLLKINNQELIKSKIKKSTILFQIDTKRSILYCNYDIIWSKISSNDDYRNIQTKILNLIKNNEKLKNLTPFRKHFSDDELKYVEICSF